MNPWVILAAVLALAGAGFGGYRHGLEVARAECAQEQQAAREAADLQAEQQRVAARAADAAHARWRADQERRHAKILTDLRNALLRPISRPAGAALADVPVPADVVGRLRDAGSDYAAQPGPAASAPGR